MQTNFTPFAMVLIPVPHQQQCSWFGACWFCVECPEMSMTQRCWAGCVALWSWSPPPMTPLESESRTQTSVQALSSHPQLAAPGQPVARWGWQFSPLLRFQKLYIDQVWQFVFTYTQVKSIGGHLRQRLTTARCDVQHNMMTSQNELDSIRLMISMRKWFC